MMIELYCRKVEKNTSLCPSCRLLQDYAIARLDHCRFGNSKPACKSCKTHCYKPEMRAKIRIVMCTIGPRLFFYAPRAFFLHLIGK